jgi:hypothetical protein
MQMPPSQTSAGERMTPTQRARLGGLAFAARNDTRKAAAHAREGFAAKFVREAIEIAAAKGENLTDDEAQRRATALRKAYEIRLAMAGNKARRERYAARQAQETTP